MFFDFAWTAEDIAHKKLTKHASNLIVKIYRSGEQHKIICRGLVVPWKIHEGHHQSRKCGTMVTLPKARCTSKIDGRTWRKMYCNTEVLIDLQHYRSCRKSGKYSWPDVNFLPEKIIVDKPKYRFLYACIYFFIFYYDFYNWVLY